MSEQIPPERPPEVDDVRWPRAYALLLGWLALQIAAYWILTAVYA
jgi:hypothetical protein